MAAWQKAGWLVALLGSVAWFSRSPDWEPALMAVSFLVALVGEEIADRRRQQVVPSAHVEHDRELFRRYAELLSELRLIDEVNHQLFNGRTDSRFAQALRNVLRLATLGEGVFLLPAVRASHEQWVSVLGDLQEFIAVHFFPQEPPITDDDRMFLYPDHRRRGDPDGLFERRRSELLALLDKVDDATQKYRSVVRRELAI